MDDVGGDPGSAAAGDLAWWRQQREARLVESGAVVIADTCMYRPGQLLLSDDAAALLADPLAELGAERDPETPALADLRLQRWRVEAGIDLPELVLRLRSDANALRADRDRADEERALDVTVSLNHVLSGQPKLAGGPAGPPTGTGASRSGSGGDPGRAADITVLDTGYAADVATHHPHVAAALRPDADDVDALLAPGGSDLLAEAGHGTFIAGLVLLVAPDLAIDPGRVLDPDGICDEVELATELAQARRSAPVVNMSLGGYTLDDAPPPALARSIERLLRDRVVVAAAGNDGTSRPFWPAALKHVVAVAAVDDPGSPAPAPWTNRGPWVDVCTQGVDLLSTYVAGRFPTGPGQAEDFTAHPWATWSGTSFAAPLVAAEIARRVRQSRIDGAPVSADQARRDLLAALSPVPGHPELGLLYVPPTDPRLP